MESKATQIYLSMAVSHHVINFQEYDEVTKSYTRGGVERS